MLWKLSALSDALYVQLQSSSEDRSREGVVNKHPHLLLTSSFSSEYTMLVTTAANIEQAPTNRARVTQLLVPRLLYG